MLGHVYDSSSKTWICFSVSISIRFSELATFFLRFSHLKTFGIVQVHLLEDAVNVAGRNIISELPFLEMFNHVVRDRQLGLAGVTVLVQVFAGRDFEIGVGDCNQGEDDENFHVDLTREAQLGTNILTE